MSITAKKITSTTVLKGVTPSGKALPVISNDINPIIDDLEFLDSRITDLEDGDIAIDSITPDSGVLEVNGGLAPTGDIDASAALNLTGNATIGGTLKLNGTPQTLTGAGAVSVSTSITRLITTGANALTLAAGANGQIKIISMVTDGGDGTLIPSNRLGYASITFNDVGDTITLIGITDGSSAFSWAILANQGCTIA